MKTKLILTLFAAGVFLTFSCKKDETISFPVTGEYLPLQIHNYWLIDHYDQIDVTGTQVIENKEYFVLVQGTDTNYYRIENNKVFVRRLDVSESVKFDLTANVGESWQFQGWNVEMASKTDTVVINNTKIPNCYRFFFDVPVMVDDEHSIWLAPGIGFIKMTCGFCPFPSLNLIKANINSKEITFP
jgi:hypothetical protein